MILEGHVIDDTRPIMKFYFDNELHWASSTDFWGASIPCLIKMCERAGFKHVELVSRYRDRVIIKAYNEINKKNDLKTPSDSSNVRKVTKLLALGLRTIASYIDR